MTKIARYTSVLFLLFFARWCDFYSTSLWIFQENGIADETNPLTQLFGVGWNGLIVVNLVVVILICYCYYQYIFNYQVEKNLKSEPNTFKEYASILYYEKKNQLWRLLYQVPKNKKAAIAHTGYIAVWAIILGSFLAMAHNLLQFYDNQYYDIYLEAIRYPRVVFYSMVTVPIIFMTIKLYKSEFSKYKQIGSDY